MHSPKISVVIPHYPIGDTNKALDKCVKSLSQRGATEIIVYTNYGDGYSKAVNAGMKLASGDFICVVNNDTEVVDGFLSWLCKENAIATPMIFPPARDTYPRCFFCVPRHHYEQLKEFKSDDFFDERFHPGYFEDDDLIQRIKLLDIRVEYVANVVVHHQNGGGLTMKQLGEQESFDINKKRFEEKWGEI